MVLDMFTVHDSQAGAFCTPFFSSNISTAMRSFAFAANDLDQDIGRFPSDFTLYHMGTYDDSNGEITTVPLFKLAHAVTLVKQQQPQVEELENV